MARFSRSLATITIPLPGSTRLASPWSSGLWDAALHGCPGVEVSGRDPAAMTSTAADSAYPIWMTYSPPLHLSQRPPLHVTPPLGHYVRRVKPAHDTERFMRAGAVGRNDHGSKHGISSAWSGSSRRMSLSLGKRSLYWRINRGNPAHAGSIRAWISSQSDRAEAPAKYVSRMDMVRAGGGT
jgi:hypothetical protein